MDSALITKNPVAINITKNDSLFIKADTLISLGLNQNRKLSDITMSDLLKDQ